MYSGIYIWIIINSNLWFSTFKENYGKKIVLFFAIYQPQLVYLQKKQITNRSWYN